MRGAAAVLPARYAERMSTGPQVDGTGVEARPGLAVRVRGVRREFPDPRGGAPLAVLEALDLAVEPHEFVAILGPSGSGKSTLLRMIAGLDRPSSGTIALLRPGPGGGSDDGTGDGGGDRATGRAGDVGFVFQDAHLLPWRDVLGNVTLPLELLGVPPAERRRAALEALAAVELADFAAHRPAQLSGGMRMRVSLARTLVTQPRLLLLDEPFAALDELTRQSLDEALRALWDESGMTVVFVTHSIGEAAFLADRAVVLSSRPGRVVADVEVDLPAERTAELRGEARFAAVVACLHESLRRGSERS
jgi:NitT/TauT family transport system ATP-binding protein